MHEQKGKTRTMHHALFSTEIIEKHQHEKGVLVGIGRDLKLPQSIALSQCRLFSTKLYQMWSDGFTVDYTLECLTDWILEEAKTDDGKESPTKASGDKSKSAPTDKGQSSNKEKETKKK